MSFLVSASGLSAQRTRMNVIAENLANASTTRPQTYRRKMVLFAERLSEESRGSLDSPATFEGGGVRVVSVQADRSPQAFRLEYNPGHPDADDSGYVLMPNINPVHEMVNLIDAMRAYEANVTAISASKQMMTRALEIGRT